MGPNGGTHPEPRRDESNNVEKVIVTTQWAAQQKGLSPEHSLSLHVSAYQVASVQGQTYALLISGPEGMQVRDLGPSLLDSAGLPLSLSLARSLALVCICLVM